MNTFMNTIGEVRMPTTPEDVERDIDARMPPRWREHERALRQASMQQTAPAPAECSTEVGAEPMPHRVPANSAERAHRVLVGGVVLLLVVVGVVAVVARMGAGL